jgi:hypothetical protein
MSQRKDCANMISGFPSGEVAAGGLPGIRLFDPSS